MQVIVGLSSRYRTNFIASRRYCSARIDVLFESMKPSKSGPGSSAMRTSPTDRR